MEDNTFDDRQLIEDCYKRTSLLNHNLKLKLLLLIKDDYKHIDTLIIGDSRHNQEIEKENSILVNEVCEMLEDLFPCIGDDLND